MTSIEHFSPAPARLATRAATLLATIAVIVAGSLALGGLTAWGQGQLRGSTYLLVDSAGPWVLIAVTLAALTRTSYGSVLAGATALSLLELGYAAAARAEGNPPGYGSVAFWLTAAVLAGPAVGLAGHWLRRGDAVRAALGAGLIGGTLIGEAVYFRTELAATSYADAELATAAVLLVGAALGRFPRPGPMAVALVTAAPAAILVLRFLRLA